MWFSRFMQRLSMTPTIGPIPDQFCPLCSQQGKKSGLMGRTGRLGPFSGCSAYPGCKYIQKSYGPQPLSEAQFNQLSQQQASGVVPIQQNIQKYCPECSKRGILSTVSERTTGQYGDFFACDSYRSAGCKYSYNPIKKWGEPPLNAETAQQITQQFQTGLVQTLQGEQPSAPMPQKTDDQEMAAQAIEYFKSKPVVSQKALQCPFGDASLRPGKPKADGSIFYWCKECGDEGKRKFGVFVIVGQSSKNMGEFSVYTTAGPGFNIRGGQAVDRSLNIADIDINTITQPEIYGDFHSQSMDEDNSVFGTANASTENNAGQGAIVQGSIRIMSDEERSAIPYDGETTIAGMTRRTDKLFESLYDYIELEEFQALDPTQQTATTPDGRIILVADKGLYDEEKVKIAAKSPLYPYTEIGARKLLPNPSQANALELLTSDEARNIILCLPTGVGKTTIAEAAIADSKMRAKAIGYSKPVSVYVCPARALTAQIARDFSYSEKDFVHPFMKNGWKTTMLRGIDQYVNDDDLYMAQMREIRRQKKIGTQVVTRPETPIAPQWDKNLVEDANQADIIVITPEKFLRCLQNPTGSPWVNRITTVIFDEGHLIGERGRGPNFETEQIEIYNKFKRLRDMLGGAARIIYMSATMQNAIELAAWQQSMTDSGEKFEGMEAEKQSKWALVWGEWKPIEHEIDYRIFPKAEEGEEEDNVAKGLRALKDLVSTSNLVQNKKSKVVMRPTLVFVQSFADGYDLRDLALNYFWQCTSCGRVLLAPTGPEGGALDPSESPNFSCPACGSMKTMGRWMVPFHNSSADEKEEIVNNFNNDYQHHPVLIATSTLAAGVNTGAYTVVIYGTDRAGTDIETSQLMQEMGRSGRQKYLTEFPGVRPRIIVYSSPDRKIYDQRRLNAKAFLESKLNNRRKLTDSVLRAIGILGITDAANCGKYVASTFAYFQNQVDAENPMNARRGLEHICKSWDLQNGTDRVQWAYAGRGQDVPGAQPCPHSNLIDSTRAISITQAGKSISMPKEFDENGTQMFCLTCMAALKDQNGKPMVDTSGQPMTCGALGYMPQVTQMISPEKFQEYIEDVIRDLVAYGMVVIEDGQYKITMLGRQIMGASMPVADTVDIIKNMYERQYNPDTSTSMDLAVVLGNLTRYDDPQEDAYISQKQAEACLDATVATFGVPDVNAATPAMKRVQCLYWILNGIHPRDKDSVTGESVIPDCMSREYYITADEYKKSIFLMGLGVLAGRAGWWKDAPEEFEAFKTQMVNNSKQAAVPPDAISLVVAEGIGALTAKMLNAIGVYSLLDLMIISKNDLALRLGQFYRERDEKKGFVFDYGKQADKLQNLAQNAISGNQLTSSGRVKSMTKAQKLQYWFAVNILNRKENIDKMRARRGEGPIMAQSKKKAVFADGWFTRWLK